ncbi:MAG: transposase [Deltaproteobacteria bacterium]|nr:transposase [Deltaproteobacteria bacterium]
MKSQNRYYKKRRKIYDYPGHAHYLTFSCFHRQAFLTGSNALSWLVEFIETARCSVPFDLWAYVFMPEHVHILLRPHEGIKISAILKQIKQPVAIRAVKHIKAHAPEFLKQMRDLQLNGRYTHRFWQRGGGYDRNLWTQKDIHTKIRYIHANPVRRGLVSSPADWPWSSFGAWEEDSENPLRIDRDFLIQVFP